jgi:hypothetical protein
MKGEKSSEVDSKAAQPGLPSLTTLASMVDELDDKDLNDVSGGANSKCPVFNVVQGCGCG